MVFSSKQENDYESQLEQIAGEVDSYIVKTDGALKYFRKQIRPLAQRWKAYREAVDKRKKELSDHWEKVKKNPKLQDKNISPSKEWEWDRFYLGGLDSFGSNPINEMPAKYALDVMAALEKYLERNEKNEQGYPENSSEYKRLQETIAEQRQNLEDIRSEFDKVSSTPKNNIWIKTPPKTVIPNRTYFKFTWWRYLNLQDENVFGCWRPPLIPLPEYPLNILKPVESGYQRNQPRKELPDARNTQEEYERYYIFLSSVHDNYLKGVEKITEGIWLDNLSISVLCCLDKGHGDKTTFLKAALERVCQSNHKTDKKKEQEKGGWGLVKKISLILGIIVSLIVIVGAYNKYVRKDKPAIERIKTQNLSGNSVDVNNVVFDTRPTAYEIIEEIKELPVYERDAAAENYKGRMFKWSLRFKSLGPKEPEMRYVICEASPVRGEVVFYINADAKENLKIKKAKEGVFFDVSGEIERISLVREPQIKLKDVRLEFFD